MQSASPFFSLPAEVRDRIYEFYLAPTLHDFEDTLKPHKLYLPTNDSNDKPSYYSRPLPALMQTCKRAHAELTPAVHERAYMRVSRRGRGADARVGFAVHGPLRPARLRTLYLLVHLAHPGWNAWLYFLGDVLRAAAPSLRVLVIDWAPTTKSQGWVDEFFKVVEAAELRTIVLFGEAGVPRGWVERLEGMNTPRLVRVGERWWRECEGVEG